MNKLLSLAIVVSIFTFSACNNDEEISGTPKTEAKATIASIDASAKTELQQLSSSEGIQAIADLNQITTTADPFAGRVSTDKGKLRAFLKSKGHKIRGIVSPASSGRASGLEPFDYNAHLGVYVYNFTTETFDKTQEVSNIIRIQFPTEGSTTNDAEFQLKAYEEVMITDVDGFTSYEPTVISASLLVQQKEVAALELDAEYGDDGFPVKASIEASASPFVASVSFDVTSSTKNTASASLKNGNKTLFASTVSVNYSTSQKNGEDITTVVGFVQLLEMKIEGSIDIAKMANDLSPDFNKYIDLQLLANDKKLGDIVFVTEMVDGYESQVAYLQYSDGSKEKLEDVLAPLKEELEALEADLNS